jgi:hypothetical protein
VHYWHIDSRNQNTFLTTFYLLSYVKFSSVNVVIKNMYFRDNIARNKHFLAPEWGTTSEATLNTAIDIYAFGMCALETAALELLPAGLPPASSTTSGNGSGGAGGAETSGNGHQNGAGNGNQDNEGGLVTEESIQRTIGKS